MKINLQKGIKVMKKKVLLIAAITSALLFAGCNDSAVENIEYTKANNGAQVITEDTAKRASVSSQKLNSEDVTFTAIELDDDGKYEVEFIYDGYKYKVDIDAETGDVKDVEKEAVTDDILAEIVITKEEAINAALAKAKLESVNTDELLYFECELDKKDAEYEIEFVYGDQAFDITVSAIDGSIIEFEQTFANDDELDDDDIDDDDDDDDIDDDDDDDDIDDDIDDDDDDDDDDIDGDDDDDDDIDDDDDDDDESPVIDANCIDKDAALNIALEHAGVTNDDVTNIHVKLDMDDNKAEYEIEFICGYIEYDYDIDAVTGEIINFDREGEHVSAPDFSAPAIEDLISEADAKAYALAHAGVNEADIFGFEIELDKDNGIMKYEIEFKSGEYEYEYDINAVDGSVINFAKEIDD